MMLPPRENDRQSENNSGDIPANSQHHYYGNSEPASPTLGQSYSFAGAVSLAGSFMERRTTWEEDARPLLPKAAFFMGDLRDGLPMVRSTIAIESNHACISATRY